jgi:hypothetical protein
MLSRQEKNEMLEDARSLSRREAFRKVRESALSSSSRCLDDYLDFLNAIHKIFPPKELLFSPPFTDRYKL